MLNQFIEHIFADPFLKWCSAIMLSLAFVDLLGLIAKLFGFRRIRHIDFKTSIVSIGLFATFYGVLVGLYGFDPKNVAQSVPHLLEGLRFAFGASVLGMFLSVALSILHKLVGGDDDDEEILHSIDKKLGDLLAANRAPEELGQQFSELKDFLADQLQRINMSLDQALVQLAKGATNEVTEALRKIILEFNRNLTEQFGENFKQLNTACRELVIWQDKYKNHLDTAEKSLAQVQVSLDQSCQAAEDIIANNRETQEICREVGQLIGTYDIQIKTLETHLSSCKELGEKAGDFLAKTNQALMRGSENLDNFSGVIEQSVSKQSESLAQLTKDLNERLPVALGDLEKVLTSITNQFAADYRSLFQFITDKR